MLRELSYDRIEPHFDINIFEVINTSVSNEENKIINDEESNFINHLSTFVDDPVYKIYM